MKPKTPDTAPELDEACCIYGAGVLLKPLEALQGELEGVRSGHEDIEYIHRARVASRRLRAAIPLFQACLPQKKSKKWLKEIRQVTRALGDARDTDVQLERVQTFYQQLSDKSLKTGIKRLILRLNQKRARLQPPITQAVQHLRESKVLEALHEHLAELLERENQVYLYTPTLYQHSFQSILKRLTDLLTFQEVVMDPEKVAELHQMRIAAKWLRYTMENFTGLYSNQLKPYLQAVRKLQDLLGEIHDCDVWQMFLPDFLEEERLRTIEYFGSQRAYRRFVPGILAFEQDRLQARGAYYQTFVCTWQDWQTEKIWDELINTIQVPFLQPSDLYPPQSPSLLKKGEENG